MKLPLMVNDTLDILLSLIKPLKLPVFQIDDNKEFAQGLTLTMHLLNIKVVVFLLISIELMLKNSR